MKKQRKFGKKINRQQFLKIKKENEIRKFSVGFPKKRKKVTATKGRCYPAAKRPIQYDCKDSNKIKTLQKFVKTYTYICYNLNQICLNIHFQYQYQFYT